MVAVFLGKNVKIKNAVLNQVDHKVQGCEGSRSSVKQ